MIARMLACCLPLLGGLQLAIAAPAPAQTASAPAFPVTGKVCWFDRRGYEAGIASTVAASGGTPAQQAKSKEEGFRAMMRALAQSANAAQCSVVLKSPPKTPSLVAAGQDLQPEIVRLVAGNAARGGTFTGAPSTGICIVSTAFVNSLTPGREQALIDAGLAMAEQVANERRCGETFDQSAQALENASLDITQEVMARVMGARPACAPGKVIESGYWQGRRCIAVGGKWSGAVDAEGEEKLLFRGTAGQWVRVTATRGNRDKKSLCVPRIDRLTSAHWNSEVKPTRTTLNGNFSSNPTEFMLPYTTDYSTRLFCKYEQGISTESQNQLGISIEVMK